jgi:putative N6-adenine-specific DNA methylase
VPDPATQQVLIRLVNNQCTISLDTSGELLHRRGYRLATAKAPLRETLACAVLTLCGWRPDQPLLDPFCGAGTFAIEAARWVLGIPPGWDRSFAFHSWPSFDQATWEALRAGMGAARRAALPCPITCSDREPGAVRMARDNAARAGVVDLVPIEQGDFFDLRPGAPPGLVVINAPYGHRVGHGDLRALYRHLGDHLREHFRGWRYAVLCGNPTLARATGLTPDRGHSLLHGGRHVPLLHGLL